MGRNVVVVLVLACAWSAMAGAGQGTTSFYVQLIRGTESNRPPHPGCKQVGPKLAGTFCPVFKLKHYWELSCQEVAVAPGRATRVKLGNGREAEIDLRNPKERSVAAFQDGQLVERTVIPAGEAMTIIGGNRDGGSVWFIVVRRDKPPD